MPNKLRWGILGTGNIARQFAVGVASSRRTALAAVGSRTEATARAFATAHNIPRAHDTYDALFHDDTVDAIYLSLPNSMHHEWTIRALQAGKHVLCEKPFATNLAQAEEMFAVARHTGRILVEAFMYRSQPLMLAVLDTLRSGILGDIKLIRTSFCYRTTKTTNNVRFDASLAGGALMDIGCYCINLTRLVAGAEPTTLHAAAHLHPSGVDDFTVATLTFPGDILATFACGMTAHADNTAHICGTEGSVEIPVPWKPPAQNALYTITRGTPPKMDGPTPIPFEPRQTFSINSGQDLYAAEADDFAATVLDNAPPRIPPDDSLGNQQILDEMRRQIGLPF